MTESPALLLCKALDAVEALRAQGYPVTVAEKTRSVIADERMCELIAEDLGLRKETALDLFEGMPVKEARALSRWAKRLPEEERIGALRRRSEKKNARKAS